MPAASSLDRGRQRGAEEEGLALTGQQLDDAAHVMDEAHVEHAVHFVEHEELDAGKLHVAWSTRSSKRPAWPRAHQRPSPAGATAGLVDAAKDEGVAHLDVSP
jgi:hypothetical protein